jgi:hypothetical protein
VTALEHALAYAARGWRVAPIAPGTKWPRISEWQTKATTDAAIVTTWWHRFPGDGVSIVTGEISNLVVVDVDPRHDGDETLADLERLHGPLPDTMESITGGGGRHLYFRWPDGVPFPRNDQTAATLGAGLDVRGEGGQVVAPPTIHPDTAIAYAWEVAHDPFDGVTPVLPPAWLIDMLTATPPPRVARSTTGRALGDRPGDIFERSTTWPDLLGAAGWTLHSVAPDGHELWCRPGKEIRQGPSASLYYRGSDVLKVFTTSAAPLEATRTYDRWGFHVVTTQGSMSNEAIAAASSLYRKALNSMGSVGGTQVPIAEPPSTPACPCCGSTDVFEAVF